MNLSRFFDNNGDQDHQKLQELWDSTEAAGEYSAVPAGEYITHIVRGERSTSKVKGTPSYKLTFKILEGDFAGSLLWLDLWLTAASMPQTKRDLQKLSINSISQLQNPIPLYFRCKCKVTLRLADDGSTYNLVKWFEVLGFDNYEEDPFAPKPVATPPTDPSDTLPSEAAKLQSQTQNAKGGADDAIPF